MNYYSRLSAAAIASLLVHLLALFVVRMNDRDRVLGTIPEPDPIVLNLQPPADPPRRLIDTPAPAEDVERETDLISNADSAARDALSGGDDGAQPKFEETSEFDELTGTPQPVPHVSAAPPAAESPAQDEGESGDVEADEPVETAPAEPAIGSESFEPSTLVGTEKSSDKEMPEAFDVAQAEAPPVVQEIGATRGRDAAGAAEDGPISFEANRHALGDYMLEVRRKVERTWRTSIQFKYSGTSQASALLECSIQPDGQLAHVKILERGESVVYAALCKQAIERAAPFGPFPFDVPLAYRSQNLVIRWKFSFM